MVLHLFDELGAVNILFPLSKRAELIPHVLLFEHHLEGFLLLDAKLVAADPRFQESLL